VSISNIRKGRAETPPIVSKSQRRPVGGALLHRYTLRVNAAELARRRILHLTAGAAALPAVSRFAWTQPYPTRPVRLIVGYPAVA
jgi:hypothetical protein